MTARPSLRESVTDALAALPSIHALGVTVLSSAPKRTTALYPHAPTSTARCIETEYLVVVHCALEPGAELSSPETATSNPSSTDAQPPTAVTDASDASRPAGNVLAAAISAHVYTLPTSPSSPATSIVYISKVDSSGYAPPTAGPITRELAISVLTHFLGPATRPTPRVSATLFARSQGQYLFPNSVEGGGKRVLGGLGLCGWWKGVYEGAAARLVEKGLPAAEVALRYMLPAYSAAEAAGMLGAPKRPLPAGVKWVYAPPFVTPLLPDNGLAPSLATLIPSLPDDPKTRFLDELVASALEAAPLTVGCTGSITSAASGDGSQQPPTSPKKRTRKEKDAAEEEDERRKAHAALAKIPPEEFWERLGFRQECASGDVTGFFSLSCDTPAVPAAEAAASAYADAVVAHGEESKPVKDEEKKNGDADKQPTKSKTSLNQKLVERVLTSLLNTDFGTRALAAQGTAHWLATTRALVVDEIGEDGWAACTSSIAPKTGVDAPVPQKRKEETVTMLQPRKKAKPRQ